MEIKNSHLLILFILLVGTLFLTLHTINEFMPKYATCEDDFEVINKCKCLPGEYPLTFPNQHKDKSNSIPNG